ncbi:hypothetical protein ACFFIX_11345 [Metabacillus herbersteinensis]|uniref:Phosphatase PAP2 family protein n=1 Tax=Metabacillus herbersteinensis TaxID=283816 RepID=A0ABV6GF72_9BACI
MKRLIISGSSFFVVIALIISLHTSFIAKLDQMIGAFFQSIKQPTILLFLEAVGTLGSTVGIIIGLLVSMVIVFIIFKKPLPSVILFIGVIVGNVLNKFLKEVTEKERPIVPGHLNEGFSFPSGHVMVGTVLYGLFVYFLLLKVRSQGEAFGD